jgi:GH15 family glucan-1,4-alpha-glucosidase
MQSRIEDYAFIGDCHSGALVSRNGSIDWLCLPRFDSGAIFSAILGESKHGHWQISPRPGTFSVKRRYLGESMLLETLFETETGSCRIIDGMLRGTPESDLIRIVEGISGTVELELQLVVRFDYGSIVPWLERSGPRSFHAIAGPDALEFLSPVDFINHDLRSEAKFDVKAGERLPFTLTWYPSHLPFKGKIKDVFKAIDHNLELWNKWASLCQVQGPGRECIIRSLLTLKALTYAPTGGIVAALTTSLPEEIGGERNWDYRFCWVRDATFTLYSLLLGGYREEAQAWVDWLVRAVAGTPSQVNIMYGIAGERRLPEWELDWLPGHFGSKPVRIGNGAHTQVQLDIFGELLDTAWLALKRGIAVSEGSWRVMSKMLEHLAGIWERPDSGIWEVRGPPQHFTHSKVMAWVAFDRAIKISKKTNLQGPVEQWAEIRDAIHRDVCARGYNEKLNSFTQYYGGESLDASLLQIALVGFLPADDPRISGTVEAIERSLLLDGFVRRYIPDQTPDGLRGQEGVFLACSFWLVDTYILQGRHAEAKSLFDRLLSVRNDVGLLAEEYDPVNKRMLGNFPQAFSMISLVNSAFHFYTADSSVIERSKEAGK